MTTAAKLVVTVVAASSGLLAAFAVAGASAAPPPCKPAKSCTTTDTSTGTTTTTTTSTTTTPTTTTTTTTPTTTTTEPTPGTSANLVTNPSVERDLSNVGVLGSATLGRVTDWARDGSYSAKVATAGAAVGEGVYNGRYAVASGSAYTASVWVYAPAAMTVRVAHDEFSSSGGWVRGGAGADVTFGAKEVRELTYSLTPGAQTATLTLHVTTRATAQRVTFYADLWALRSGSSTTTSSTTATTTTGTTTTTPTTTTTGDFSASGRWFSSSSPWNAPYLGESDVTSSALWISGLYNAVGQINVNQGAWTPPVYVADASAPRGTVTLDNGWSIDDVPLPSTLKASGDSDAHAIVLDTARGREYDFFALRTSSTSPSGWHAHTATVLQLDGSGWWNGAIGPWGARASSAALGGGLIRPSEVASGTIPHALGIALPKQLIGPALSPATTSDGGGGGSALPMGSRLVLDPSVDVTRLGLEPGEVILARALQQYGAYVVDSSCCFAIYAQNYSNLGSNPYPGSWANGVTKELIRYLRVVAPPPAPPYDSRLAFGQPHV